MNDRGSREFVDTLPPHLAERVRVAGPGDVARDAEFVLVWMRVAVRAHENPALDVALETGRRLGVPVFVYQALSERYPYASDRHHRFVLEGARDVARDLVERGIGHAFHLERPGHRGPYLLELAARAAVVVTEEFPVPPLRGWTERLARRAPCAVWTVDTDCIVPMRRTRSRPERAFRFRESTARLRAERLLRPWQDSAPHAGPFVPPDLPFAPLDLETVDLNAAIASCAIDHGVPPVADTVGGSRAGYARWEAFRDHRLARYARDRNDALRDGVSRLSPYLHHGHVSPFRIAREAAERDDDGARKFLDELVVWRELAHAFCFHTPDVHDLEAVPGWAVETLREHVRDPRERSPDDAALDEARTGDPLWDAAQISLRERGELHNNLRMTWGKAIVAWSPDAATALRRLIDLNHRYALDGRDPNSYGGLLWCLGQFDRPFDPPSPVFGRVRSRSTRAHATRLDPARYLAKVRSGRRESSPGRTIPGLFDDGMRPRS
jgi:photolyase PhrII